MGRHSSDSEEDRKKRKKKKKKRSRSRSRSSESKYSSKQKKSKKSKKKRKSSRSRSRSLDSHRRSRSRSKARRSRSYERSRSYDRYHSRSRSRSRSKYSRRSRSLSRGRYSRSRSRDRTKRRSRSYERHSRRSRSRSTGRKDRRKYSEEREDPCLTIPGFSELPPSEQAKIRMQMALKAAAAADEKIKGDTMERPTSFKDQMAFNQAIQDIESSGFEAQYFKSNSWEKKDDSTSSSKDEFTFGTAGEIKLDSYQKKPPLINVDTDDLADPSLHVDPEEKMDRWIQKLSAMRRRKLEGEALA